MDAYEEMLDLARRTVATLTEKGVKPRPFEADDGTTVKGWCVKQLADHAKDEYRGLNNWEEFRCAIELVLAADGRFFLVHRDLEQPFRHGRPSRPRTLMSAAPRVGRLPHRRRSG
ncbi:hypothetical protein [Streptomyces sp. NPDC058726]|uniref:hypothetical protein n=1 Tax=Streptomyces sp. NPDC058726 TaxID=3346611 RepID=UPI00369F4D3D